MSCFMLGETRKIACFKVFIVFRGSFPCSGDNKRLKCCTSSLQPSKLCSQQCEIIMDRKKNMGAMALGLKHSLGDFELPVFVSGTASVFYPM